MAAFVIASGPSLTRDVCDKIRGHNAIVVNASFRLAPWAPILFFTDSSFYEQYWDAVEAWNGEIVTLSKAAKRDLSDRVQLLASEGDPSLPLLDFPPAGAPAVAQGRTSGHTATSVAVAHRPAHLGLVGFDMRVVDGREHHHAEYKGPRDLDVYASDYVPAFVGWNAAALRAGVKIWNCTPGSAVNEFEFADVDEVIACARS
jgi:hypothetical protein